MVPPLTSMLPGFQPFTDHAATSPFKVPPLTVTLPQAWIAWPSAAFKTAPELTINVPQVPLPFSSTLTAICVVGLVSIVTLLSVNVPIVLIAELPALFLTILPFPVIVNVPELLIA